MSEEKPKTRKAPRSSVTGRFVRKDYARRHPNTTSWDSLPVTPREKSTRQLERNEDGRFIADDTPIEVIDAESR